MWSLTAEENVFLELKRNMRKKKKKKYNFSGQMSFKVQKLIFGVLV